MTALPQPPADHDEATAAGRAPSVQDLVSAFANAPIGMAIVTPLGVITACNPAIELLLGRAQSALIGRTFFDVTHPDDVADARRSCALMHEGETRILRHECRFLRADTSSVWVLVSTSRVPATPTHPAHLIMHIEDISDRKTLEAELIHHATHDPLTGLANRALLTEQIRQKLGHDRPPSHLFYVDLDGFKAVNDRYGHAAGDQVLIQFARRVTASLKPGDTAARLGGDEFAVLRVNTGPEEADTAAARLRAAAATPFLLDGGHVVMLSAAVGHTTVAPDGTAPPDPRTPDPAAQSAEVAQLFREADRRMYAVKQRSAWSQSGHAKR